LTSSSAFILIDCDFPFSETIIEELKRIPEIEEFYRVQSIYDIIAKVNADSKDQLYEIVVRKVREIEGIKNTLTMIIL
jgi:DNA-binding Lrp family transcriptional regulator